MAGKAEPGAEFLAGKSTLNRMELAHGMPRRYKKITFWRDSVDELLVDVFLEAHPIAPGEIVLDIDHARDLFQPGCIQSLDSNVSLSTDIRVIV